MNTFNFWHQHLMYSFIFQFPHLCFICKRSRQESAYLALFTPAGAHVTSTNQHYRHVGRIWRWRYAVAQWFTRASISRAPPGISPKTQILTKRAKDLSFQQLYFCDYVHFDSASVNNVNSYFRKTHVWLCVDTKHHWKAHRRAVLYTTLPK
jgi:hypothetical protein